MANKIGFKSLNQVTGSTDVMYADRRQFYLGETFLSTLWETVSPFTNFSAQMNTITDVRDVDYKMFESRPYWVDNFKAYSAGSSGTMTHGTRLATKYLDNGSSVGSTPASIVGTVCEVWDTTGTTTHKATVIISSVTTGSTKDTIAFYPIYVAVSGTTALADNDIFYVIGHASEEGSTSPNAYSDDLSVIWNSCQQFESIVYASDRARLAKLRPVNEWARMMDETGKAHKMRVENALLFGARRGGGSGSSYDAVGAPYHIATADGASERMTTTCGFNQLMRENGGDPSTSRLFTPVMSTYTWPDFVDDMINIAYYQEGTEELYAFSGPDALGFFDKASTTGFLGDGARVNLEPSRDTEFGFKARKLYTNEIELNLVRCPAMRGRYSKYMFIADPRYVGIVKFQPSRYDTNIQENDRKARKDRYFDDLGAYITLVEKHARVIFS